jgi:anti-sigma factor RsiW
VPDHPDREQLAAWQAGDLGGSQRDRLAAHLAGCAACSATVAELDAARQRLAVLAEPEPPAGFHERLIAAVERELPAAGRPATAARRRAAWFPRPATLAAAAALLLFVVGALGLIRSAGKDGSASTAAGGGGGEAAHAPSAAAAAAGPLPEVRLAGEFSPARLQEAVDANPSLRQALEGTHPRAAASPGAASGSSPAPSSTPSASATGGDLRLQSEQPSQGACVQQALRQAGAAGLRPAFFVDTSFRSRPARLLVATATGAPDQVRYFVFRDADCAALPVAEGRTTVSLR